MIPSTNQDCNTGNPDPDSVRPLFDGHEVRTHYLLQQLLRQRAPLAPAGGREVLWFCPFCRKPWYEAGRTLWYVRLSETQLSKIARRLHADLGPVCGLPEAICPLCAAVYLGGKPGIEEYHNRRGYLLSWDASQPAQDRFFCLVYTWHSGPSGGPLLEAFSSTCDLSVTPFSQMRILLSWLAALTAPADEEVLLMPLNTMHHPGRWNPTGPGENRYGYGWKTRSPLLGEALLLLGGTFSSSLAACPLPMLIEIWRQIARIMELVL